MDEHETALPEDYAVFTTGAEGWWYAVRSSAGEEASRGRSSSYRMSMPRPGATGHTSSDLTPAQMRSRPIGPTMPPTQTPSAATGG